MEYMQTQGGRIIMEKEKYCKCLGGLVIANLEEGNGECPICKLPKKLGRRLKNETDFR